MIAPDRRLLAAVGVWTGFALLGVFAPALWPLLAAAALALVGLAAWDLLALRRAPRVQLTRQLPVSAFVQRRAELALQVANRDAVAVECDLFDPLPADLAADAPARAGVLIAPGATFTWSYAAQPAQRGDRRLDAALALRRSPLGCWRRREAGQPGALLRVFPDATRFLRPQALDPRQVLAQMGIKPARRRGDGMDFESLRDYLPGDDPRRVDWRATARRGRLVVRQFQHERNHTVLIAVDSSRLMGGDVDGRHKLDHAIDAALALAYAALAAGDRVGMLVFDRELRGYCAPRPHPRQLGACLELLRGVQPRLVEADYRALLRALAARHRQRALVVVLTDFVEAGAAAFAEPLAVLGRHHRLLLVALRDVLLDESGAAGLDLYRRIVLDDLAQARETALATLRRGGVQTIDLPPASVTGAVLNRYLALRHGPDR